jgi:hypothetical protein
MASESDSPQAIHARESQRLQPDRTPQPHATPEEGTSQGECPYVTGTVTRFCTLTPFTLTDAEREALEIAVEYVGSAYAVEHHARTIERLLERTR